MNLATQILLSFLQKNASLTLSHIPPISCVIDVDLLMRTEHIGNPLIGCFVAVVAEEILYMLEEFQTRLSRIFYNCACPVVDFRVWPLAAAEVSAKADNRESSLPGVVKCKHTGSAILAGFRA